MAFTRLDRKAALVKARVTMQGIADELGVTVSTVSHVVAGRKLSGEAARKVMAHIAELMGAPVGEVFPGSASRDGDRRASGAGGRRITDQAA